MGGGGETGQVSRSRIWRGGGCLLGEEEYGRKGSGKSCSTSQFCSHRFPPSSFTP